MYQKVLFIITFIFGTSLAEPTAENSTVSCTKNEIYTDCLNPCVPTCQIPYKRQCEFLICNEGCLCTEGFKKDKFQGTCIEESTCQDYCLPYQEYRECGSACPATCQNPNPVCADSCTAGCFCQEGYIFDAFYEQCVPQCEVYPE